MANRRRGPISNRRHLARQERERIQTNRIMIASIAIVAVVLVLVIYGVVVSLVIQPKQPVAVVNGEEILTREFRARVYYERLLLVDQWNRLADLMVNFGVSDPNTASFFVSQMNQIEFQLDPSTIGRAVLNGLVEDRLIRAEAAARGIVVTEEELDTAVEEYFQYYGGGYAPTPTVVPTPLPTSTLTPLQMTLTAPLPTPTLTLTETQSLTETAEITTTQTVTPTEEITPTVTLTATATVTAEITATPSVTITATPVPTATPFSLEGFQELYGDYVEAIDAYGITEEDLRYIIESELYREKLRDALTADLVPFQDQVWARHILVATEEEALEVIARVEAGENFAALAAELSTDTASAANGGDLGWFGVGQMVREFEQVAFNLNIGDVSEPVQSQFGFHVIQVLGHEERSLTAQEFEEFKDSNFGEWLSQKRLTSEVELIEIWAERVPTEPAVPAGGAQALLQQLQVPAP